MKTVDIDRLRGGAPKTTHLARYERANDSGVRRVLDAPCPHCGARSGEECVTS